MAGRTNPGAPFVKTPNPAVAPLANSKGSERSRTQRSPKKIEAVMNKHKVASGAPQFPNPAVIGLRRKIAAAHAPVSAKPVFELNQRRSKLVRTTASSDGNLEATSFSPKILWEMATSQYIRGGFLYLGSPLK
jgi:hypothetical protein